MPSGERAYQGVDAYMRKVNDDCTRLDLSTTIAQAGAGAGSAVVVDICTYPLTVCFTRLATDMAQQGHTPIALSNCE